MTLIITDPAYGYYVTVKKGEFSDGVKYYTAFAPELPHCLFQADTKEEAEKGIFDLIVHLVPLMIEVGNTPPTPLLAKSLSATLQQNPQPNWTASDHDCDIEVAVDHPKGNVFLLGPHAGNRDSRNRNIGLSSGVGPVEQ